MIAKFDNIYMYYQSKLIPIKITTYNEDRPELVLVELSIPKILGHSHYQNSTLFLINIVVRTQSLALLALCHPYSATTYLSGLNHATSQILQFCHYSFKV